MFIFLTPFRLFLISCSIALSSCATLPKPDRSTIAMGFAEAAFGIGEENASNHPIEEIGLVRKSNNDQPVFLKISGVEVNSEAYTRILKNIQLQYSIAGLVLTMEKEGTQNLEIIVSNKTIFLLDGLKAPCYTSI
jgi:hypothetical protein